MNATVHALLNQQINKEFFSAYLYLEFSNYFKAKGLDGFANWYMVQAQDTAVGSDKGEEDTERLIERRRHLLEHDLDHLHEGSDNEDEEDSLEELHMP